MTPRILAAPQVFPAPTPRRTVQELIWGGSRPYPHTPSATSGNALACWSSPGLHQARLWMSLMVPLCISIKQGHHQSIGPLVYLGCCRVVILMLQAWFAYYLSQFHPLLRMSVSLLGPYHRVQCPRKLWHTRKKRVKSHPPSLMGGTVRWNTTPNIPVGPGNCTSVEDQAYQPHT